MMEIYDVYGTLRTAFERASGAMLERTQSGRATKKRVSLTPAAASVPPTPRAPAAPPTPETIEEEKEEEEGDVDAASRDKRALEDDAPPPPPPTTTTTLTTSSTTTTEAGAGAAPASTAATSTSLTSPETKVTEEENDVVEVEEEETKIKVEAESREEITLRQVQGDVNVGFTQLLRCITVNMRSLNVFIERSNAMLRLSPIYVISHFSSSVWIGQGQIVARLDYNHAMGAFVQNNSEDYAFPFGQRSIHASMIKQLYKGEANQLPLSLYTCDYVNKALKPLHLPHEAKLSALLYIQMT